MSRKPSATVQVDVDGLWTFQEYYANTAFPATPDPQFMSAIPRFLDLFRAFGIKATFFFSGKDLEVPEKRDLIGEVLREGHELANHGTHHVLGFARLQRKAKAEEIQGQADRMEREFAIRPRGFRVPGYDVDAETLQILEELGYAYDASVFPVFYSALFKYVDFLFSKRTVRRTHGPSFRYGLAPMGPFHPSREAPWKRGRMRLWEVPVSTLPLLRFPFHGSFALLGGTTLSRAGIWCCKQAGIPVNYVFHAMDLADPIEDSRLPATRGTRIAVARKEPLFREVVRYLADQYSVMTTSDLLSSLENGAAG